MKSQLLFICGSIIFSVLGTASLDANIITVTSINDSGAGSLRDALSAINPVAGGTISFNLAGSPPWTITLTSGPLTIGANQTVIQGQGAGQLTISGGGNSTVFIIPQNVTASISGLTISDGADLTGLGGGGINNSGTLTVANCSILDCIETPNPPVGGGNAQGGGIYNSGTLTLMNCSIVSCSVYGNQVRPQGGGVYSSGNLALLNCTLSGNQAGGEAFGDNNAQGGAIYSLGTLEMTNCAISGNSAGGFVNENSTPDGQGGGIYSSASLQPGLVMVNCTVAANTAAGCVPDTAGLNGGNGEGGGLFCEGIASNITCCTFSLNAANGSAVLGDDNDPDNGGNGYGGGIYVSGASLLLENTIVSGNTVNFGRGATSFGGKNGSFAGPDVDGTVSSGGFNLIGQDNGSSGWITSGTGQDLLGSIALPLDPLLGPLQNNGGPTVTMALSSGSAAVDQGYSFGLTTDQRGRARPYIYYPGTPFPTGGNGSDIGAYELHPPLPMVNWAGSHPAPNVFLMLSWPGTVPPGPLAYSYPAFSLQKLPVGSDFGSGNWTSFYGAVRYYNGNNQYIAHDQNSGGPGMFYRLVSPATNVSFIYPAQTLPATFVNSNTFKLKGSATPYGTGTHYWFEYGTTTAYGLSTPTNNLTTSSNLLNLSRNVGSLSLSNVYHFQLVVTDNDGTELGGDQQFVTPGHAPLCTPAPAGLAYWWRGEGDAVDSAGGNDGTLQGSVFTFANGEVGSAFNCDGVSNFVSTSLLVTNPQTFSLCLWFNTSTTNGGGLISFDSTQTAINGSQYDRNIYMDNSGALNFGIWNGSAQQVSSAPGYNDGNWHLVVGTLSPAVGLSLYVDGVLIGTNPASNASSYEGYWRFGQANLNNWPNLPGSEYFQGEIDEVTVFDNLLSSNQVTAIYQAGSTGMCTP